MAGKTEDFFVFPNERDFQRADREEHVAFATQFVRFSYEEKMKEQRKGKEAERGREQEKSKRRKTKLRKVGFRIKYGKMILISREPRGNRGG